MKKLLLGSLCLFFSLFAKAQSVSDTAGHVIATVFPVFSHDSTNCLSTCTINYMVTIDSSYVGDTIKVVDTVTHNLLYVTVNTLGASPWVAYFGLPSYLNMSDGEISVGGGVFFPGPITKVIRGLDTAKYFNCNYSYIVPSPCNYGDITGTVYIDNDGDCTFSTGDVPLNGVYISSPDYLTSPAGSLTNYGYTNFSGNYLIHQQQSWMSNYVVTVPSSYLFIFPLSPCFSGSYAFTTLPQTGVDFPLQCSNSIDVQCYAESNSAVRLHTPFFIHPYVNNTGCDSVSGQMKLIKDSRAIYDASLSAYPPDMISGDTLIWNYTNLTNLTNGAYWNTMMSDIHLTADSTVIVGDTLCFRIYTGVPAGDLDPYNNDITFCLPVVYSYDPNEKDVLPKGAGPEGYISPLTDSVVYTIHFQNTGSSYAYNVKVVDTLSSYLNASSLKILGTSHLMDPEWLAPGVVRFNFNGIMLPDSTYDEAASHGDVRFSVKLNPGLTPGTQIKNTGYIYFDENPAVVTNTALNTIEITTNVNQASLPNNVKVYPNPATDNITVENLEGGTLTIVNMNGVVMLERNIVNNKTVIDISKLPAGVYVLKTTDNNNTTTKKFTKY